MKSRTWEKMKAMVYMCGYLLYFLRQASTMKTYVYKQMWNYVYINNKQWITLYCFTTNKGTTTLSTQSIRSVKIQTQKSARDISLCYYLFYSRQFFGLLTAWKNLIFIIVKAVSTLTDKGKITPENVQRQYSPLWLISSLYVQVKNLFFQDWAAALRHCCNWEIAIRIIFYLSCTINLRTVEDDL